MNIRYRAAAALGSALALTVAMGLAAAGPAGASPAPPASPAAAAATAGALSIPATSLALSLKLVRVQGSQLSPALTAHLARSGATPDATQTIEIGLYGNYSYCLDANTSGSTAGKNGDKVQLWGCSGATNQEWSLGKQNGSTGNVTLYNDKYPKECLNADDTGGLANGRKVQLWSCGSTSNYYWAIGAWSECLTLAPPGSNGPCLLYLESDNYKYDLNAKTPGIGNGDVVRIWEPIQGAQNADWVCGGSADICNGFG